MCFSFVTCVYVLNITVYLYVSSKTCVQQVFHVHSSQTDKLVNIEYVYILMIGCYGSFGKKYVFGGIVGDKKDASKSSLASAKYGGIIFYASRKAK